MTTHSPAQTPGPAPSRRTPPVIQGTMVIFYLMTWGGFLLSVAGEWGQYGPGVYLVPAALFAALLLNFPLRNARLFWHTRQDWVSWLWGFHNHEIERILFIAGGFGLIALMSAANNDFVWLYYSWWGVTLGILNAWPRLAMGMLGLELAAYGVQAGVVAGVLSGRFGTNEVWGYVISAFITIVYILMFSFLIQSRMESERLVQELQATKTRLEQALAGAHEVAVLRERTRMAREMHDGLGHALSLVAVKIEAAQRLQAVDPARATAELEATKELVRQSMADLRASLADLRAPALDATSGPLPQALSAWLAQTTQAAGLRAGCEFAPDALDLPAPIQDVLWRVGREAVLNVIKHARAATVELHIFCKDGRVYLSVADDGVGIPHLTSGQARLEVAGHYGLRGMRERLEALGGQLTLRPGPGGRGLLVLAQVPLPPPAALPVPRERGLSRLGRGWRAGATGEEQP